MPQPLATRAPAKINLTLHVLGRRADGYHELESLVAFAGTGDDLRLEPGAGLALRVGGQAPQAADGGGRIRSAFSGRMQYAVVSPAGLSSGGVAGEVGDRNVLRGQGYISLDMGLYKSFKMPWEGHALQFRWEVFNVTNTQRFDTLTISDLSLGADPFLGGNPASDFGQYTSTQTPLNETKAGRVMQFALLYTF